MCAKFPSLEWILHRPDSHTAEILYIKQERKRADLQLLSSKSIHSKNLMGKGRLSHFFCSARRCFRYNQSLQTPHRFAQKLLFSSAEHERSLTESWERRGWWQRAQQGQPGPSLPSPAAQPAPLSSEEPRGCSPHALQRFPVVTAAIPGCPLPPRSITSSHLQAR